MSQSSRFLAQSKSNAGSGYKIGGIIVCRRAVQRAHIDLLDAGNRQIKVLGNTLIFNARNSRVIKNRQTKQCYSHDAMNEQQRRIISELGCKFGAVHLLGFFTLVLLILSDVGICYVEEGRPFVIQCFNLALGGGMECNKNICHMANFSYNKFFFADVTSLWGI